jgi:hypothetical protein
MLKTQLPTDIQTVEQAQQFLTELYTNGECYHPEDSAHSINWNLPYQPNWGECEQLNNLMAAIYNLVGNDGRHSDPMIFDPCSFIISLDVDHNPDTFFAE